MVWYSHLLKNFPQFVVIHTVKGFGIVNKTEVDIFLEFCCFFHDLTIQFSHSVMSDSLWPHGLQHTKIPCPSPDHGIYSNSCSLSQWCPLTISSWIVPFSSRLQSFPALGSFPMSWFFSSSGQNIEVSASPAVFPMTIQEWFALGSTALISLQSRVLSRVSNITVQKHWTSVKSKTG